MFAYSNLSLELTASFSKIMFIFMNTADTDKLTENKSYRTVFTLAFKINFKFRNTFKTGFGVKGRL